MCSTIRWGIMIQMLRLLPNLDVRSHRQGRVLTMTILSVFLRGATTYRQSGMQSLQI